MKYKVLKEFNLNGVIQKLDTIIELDYQKASLKSIQEFIEKVDDAVIASEKKSVLESVIPGVQLTPEQKEKLAKENEKVSVESQRLAAEHIAQDQAEGKGEPVVKSVADIIKDKLINEDFEKKENQDNNVVE